MRRKGLPPSAAIIGSAVGGVRRVFASGALTPRPSPRRWLVVAALATSHGGCARYYWSRSAGNAEQFAVDSRQCAVEAAPQSVPGEYVVFRTETYRACLIARGWLRAKQWDPPPPGWFRGFE